MTFIRRERLRGMGSIDAAKHAGRARFRPILLTSITTVAGPTPLLPEKSLQAKVLIPLVASLAFGPVTADVAALFLVPAIYVIPDDFWALGALGALGALKGRPKSRRFRCKPIAAWAADNLNPAGTVVIDGLADQDRAWNSNPQSDSGTPAFGASYKATI